MAAADVYLLLLGPAYGAPLPETGKSPTEEEYVAARVKGIPRLIFRKNGVEFDSLQETFAREVESYSTGLSRNSFDGTVDLQAKVAAAPARPARVVNSGLCATDGGDLDRVACRLGGGPAKSIPAGPGGACDADRRRRAEHTPTAGTC